MAREEGYGPTLKDILGASLKALGVNPHVLSPFACWDGKYKPYDNPFDPASGRRIPITVHDHPVRIGTSSIKPGPEQVILTVINEGDDPTGNTPFIMNKNSTQLELGPKISHEHLQRETGEIVCLLK